MASRPRQLCTLKPGKAVGAHSNFAATFNWLVSWCFKFRAGEGLKLTHEPDTGSPVLSIDPDYDFGGSGDAEITIEGTDNSSHKGDKFTFESAQYSNVSVSVDGSTLKVGAFYI